MRKSEKNSSSSNNSSINNNNNNSSSSSSSSSTTDKVTSNNVGIYNKKVIYFSKPFENDDNDSSRGVKKIPSVIRPPSLSSSDSDSSSSVASSPSDQQKIQARNNLLKHFFPDIIKAIGNKAIKENPPTLKELESYLQNHFQELQAQELERIRKVNQQRQSAESKSNSLNADNNPQNLDQTPYKRGRSEFISQDHKNHLLNFNFKDEISAGNLPIVTELIKKGYLVDSDKWLRKKGFLKAGQQILTEIIKTLKADKLGMHETQFTGYGNIIQETSRKYEFGNELSNININSTLNNFVERYYESHRNKTKNGRLEFPLDIWYEDIEIYDTLEEIQVATVYCIDLSSTMKYSSMYSDLSRLEASKRALWSLFILNKKFFPLDSIYTIGFGSIAFKIEEIDIPFLRTFESHADFLHYTNYQSAYRLAKKILKKDGAKNKRIVMITDGHPSACFIDDKEEKEKIMKQRPYSHFYMPGKNRHGSSSDGNRTKLDTHEQQTVYLCYRYRQIDQYIGEQTIKEAKKLKKDGINVDTIMVSEEDSLLDFVNELAKSVDGKSIYINPRDMDKILITDYLSNKKKMIKK